MKSQSTNSNSNSHSKSKAAIQGHLLQKQTTRRRQLQQQQPSSTSRPAVICLDDRDDVGFQQRIDIEMVHAPTKTDKITQMRANMIAKL